MPRVEYEDIISGTGRLNKNIFAKESDKTGIVFHKGDVIYGKLRPYLQNWLLPSFNGLAVGDFWVLQPQNADSSFLYRLIQSRQFDEVANQSTGTKMPRSDWKLVSKTEFFIPSAIGEQAAIGAYFEQLDDLITLHQRNSADFVSRFFSDFTNTWEQRKLGKHSEIVAGGTPNTAHSEYWNPKEIPWMSSGEINKKVIYTTDNMISKIGFSNSSAKWVKEKSVLIALAGQGKTRGTVAITEISLTTNQSIAAIQPDDSLYYKYLFQNLKGRYDELRNISSGDGTRGGLNKQIISDLIVLAPDMNEQRKIGDFLCNLDNLITLHQCEYIFEK